MRRGWGWVRLAVFAASVYIRVIPLDGPNEQRCC